MESSDPTVKPYHYQSFLIRLWQEPNGLQWKGSVQHVSTNDQLFFDSLEGLFVYLLEQTRAEN